MPPASPWSAGSVQQPPHPSSADDRSAGRLGRWPLAPLRRAGRDRALARPPDGDRTAPGAAGSGTGGLPAAWSWRFPSTTAELDATRRGPRRPPTGVLVLGRGLVTAPDGSPVEGPLCVPVSVPVVLVAPPVTGRALVRSWCAQEAVAGSAPRVAHVGSLARARVLLSARDSLLVVVEGTGECWARRPHHPGERVPFAPWLVAPGAAAELGPVAGAGPDRGSWP